MHSSIPFTLIVVCQLLLVSATPACAQERTTVPLPAIVADSETAAHNRAVSLRDEDGVRFVHLDAREGAGILWIPSLAMSEGTIEARLRGRNAPGQSFVGIAFNGVNDSTYEAIYVRPFAFGSDDPVTRARALQYVSLPVHSWNVLRESSPGRYESAVEPMPEPADWLDLRLEMQGQTLRVFAGSGDDPDLVVTRLAPSNPGRIGLWVGNGSEGDFAELLVTPAALPATGSVDVEEVEFRNRDARLAGSIAFPAHGEVVAGIVFVHGSGPQRRNLALAHRFARQGIAALVYDKRGAGESEGVYAGNMSISGANIDLLAEDASAALEALRGHARMRGVPVGFVGQSQAGWIVPLAAERTGNAAFMALWSGPVCKVSEEDLFSIYTSDRDLRNLISFEEMRALRDKPYEWSEELGRDTDTVESLARLDLPGFWVFGAQDGSIPVDLSIDNLKRLIRDQGARFDFATLAGVGHATIERGFDLVVAWIKSYVANPGKPRVTERPAPPDPAALAGRYRLPDPPLQLSIIQNGASLVATVNDDTLALEFLEGQTFIGHDPGVGYVFIEFDPVTGQLIATERLRSYVFERERK